MAITTICNGSLQASINSAGAQLTSLKLCDTEYLWQGDPRWWKGQAPILFPIVGTLREGHADSSCGEVRLGRHGLARDYEHELIDASDNSVTFELRSSEETRSRFPFDFALRMTYSVDRTSLTQTFEVENSGSEELPFVVGGHPAFNVPVLDAGDSYEDYAVQFAEQWSWNCPDMDATTGLIDWSRTRPVVTDSNTLHITHELFAHDALVFEGVPSRTVTLSGPAGRGVRVDFPGFDYLGIWAAAGNPDFVAIEPWRGIATCTDETDVFEEKRGMELLSPGEVACYSFSITPF